MKLYLVRHGEAKPKSADPERHLTNRGAAEARKVADALMPLGLRVAEIWQSGKTRARETAEILAPAFGAKNVLQKDGLDPDDSIRSTLKRLRGQSADLAIVGHMPFLADLASALLTGEDFEDLIHFDTGQVICLEEAGEERWTLLWSLTPEILR